MSGLELVGCSDGAFMDILAEGCLAETLRSQG